MTDDELAKELHELKRRRETPLPLIEMFDELLSLAPGLSAKQKRKRSDEIMAAALERLERKNAPHRNQGASALISPLAGQPFPSGLSGSSAPGVAAAPSTGCSGTERR